MALVVAGAQIAHTTRYRPQEASITQPESGAPEWQLPRWVNVVGSWLFGRFVRRGWRIVFERDKPAVGGLTMESHAARNVLKEIRNGAAELRGSASDLAREAVKLGYDLREEYDIALTKLQPLLSRLARLNDGALVSRTVGFGPAMESELDGVEGEVDSLRKRGEEALSVLRALESGLAAAVASQDDTELNAALARAREYSNLVSRVAAAADADADA